MKKKILALLMLSALTVSLVSGCGKMVVKTDPAVGSESEQATETTKEEDDEFIATTNLSETEEPDEAQAGTGSDVALDTSKELTGKHHVEIKVKSYGTIKAELDADSAPITVTNFIRLAQDKFYDGLTFHRIIDGFMMQGGDPLGNGTGGSKENIKGEFATNGVDNNLAHTRGAISMARASAPNSASSQFFIVQTDSHYLDGQYAVFGYVTEGMEIVDKICKDAVPVDQNGLIAADQQPVITEVTVID